MDNDYNCYVCEDCGTTFDTPSGVLSRWYNGHRVFSSMWCPFCGSVNIAETYDEGLAAAKQEIYDEMRFGDAF